MCSWLCRVFPVLCINRRLYIIESPFLWQTGSGKKVYVRMQNNFPRLLAQCDHKTSTAHCAVTLQQFALAPLQRSQKVLFYKTHAVVSVDCVFQNQFFTCMFLWLVAVLQVIGSGEFFFSYLAYYVCVLFAYIYTFNKL